MGWDAYTKELTNVEFAAFDKAAKCAFKEAGKPVDPYLATGGLDWRDSGHFIEKALQKFNFNPKQQTEFASIYDSFWNAFKVKFFASKADWNFEYDTADKAAYFSAKYFLNTCAELNLDIYFSY